MLDTKFYPKCFGLSKADVLDMIHRRTEAHLLPMRDLAVTFTQEEQLDALTDERMQQFIDAWYGELDKACLHERADMGTIGQDMEAHLTRLAEELLQTLKRTHI